MKSQKQNNLQQVDGIFLLNKSYGMSSNHALQKVKRIFNAKKAGHTGSLDPLATGVLPICFGEATKFSGYLLDADKAYHVTAKLGSATDTLDAEGEVVATSDVPPPTDWEPYLKNFRGAIQQIPPMYSALKHNGRKLYELARAGEIVVRKDREIFMHKLICTASTADTVSFDVVCSKGTYIRTLVDDLGRSAGCLAHVIKLERYKVADFLLTNSMTLAALEEYQNNKVALLLPPDSAVLHLPKIILNADQVIMLFHGKTFHYHFVDAEIVRAYDSLDKFLGLVSVKDSVVTVKRLLQSQHN
jgi:tRNA pseudouridine55 synthase